MSPKYTLVSALLLGSIDVAIAMETADKVELEIANNRWFCNQRDKDYVCGHYDIFSGELQHKIMFEAERCNYTALGLPFEPCAFWERPIEEQLVYLKEPIQELDLLTEAPRNHWALSYTNDERCRLCLKSRSYSEELEEKFELAVWKILSKDYKITLEDFTASLRSALKPGDRIYKVPLLMHFTNYLVPRYEFYYKTKNYKRESEPYKTLKYPSIFEVVNGAENVGVVVYEATK